MRSLFLVFMGVSLSLPTVAQIEIDGRLDIETSLYEREGQFNGQDYQHNFSVALEPNIYWGAGDNSVIFTPYFRLDEHDSERSHADIRELLFTHVSGDWEYRAGIGKVFWGVTEFNQLVDIINQTDVVDSFDGEQKLGQTMLVASRVTDYGIVDAYVLPSFRERTFAGEDGRLRPSLAIATDNAQYQSSRNKKHIDLALRWSHSLDVYDIGVHAFKGTDREPLLRPIQQNGDTVLQPYYQQATQLGVDIQATIDSWLVKLESIAKFTDTDDFIAVQGGVEYSFYGVGGSLADLGVLVEYGWDERGKSATSISQNDLYLGARLALNNTNDTAILFGGSIDNDYQTKTYFLEASQRLNDYWSIAVDALIIDATDTQDPTAALGDDDRMQITLERFF